MSTASTAPPKRSAARKQAVVRADEEAVLLGGPHGDGAPPRADLGVDDREVHAGRE